MATVSEVLTSATDSVNLINGVNKRNGTKKCRPFRNYFRIY